MNGPLSQNELGIVSLVNGNGSTVDGCEGHHGEWYDGSFPGTSWMQLVSAKEDWDDASAGAPGWIGIR